MPARKSLLFNKNEIQIKKDNPDFDVTMDSFDGAEVCELVGLYLRDMVIIKLEVGDNKIDLYRDDGLSCFQNLSGLESEKIKKKLCKIFKKHGFNIAVECNLRITDFLDVTFDLRTGKYYPYRKVNNKLLYIHKQSNHPPSITKQIPAVIVKEYLIFHVINSALIKLPLSTITLLNSYHDLLREENAAETFYGSIHRLAPI